MRVTDSVVHISDRPDRKRGTEAYTLERLESDMAEAGVDRVVLVPGMGGAAEGEKRDTGQVNDYCFKSARTRPDRFVVMARIDPERPESPALLDELLERPEMRGLRLNLKHESEEAMEWIWPVAVRREMPVYILANEGRMPRLVPIVERNPEVRWILDHAGLAAKGDDPWADLDQVLALAKQKSVVVKVSGFTRHSREPYPFSDIHGHVRRLYDAYGPQRLAWGSDYSLEASRIPYSHAVNLFREACDFLSASDREWILDKTLSRVLKWD